MQNTVLGSFQTVDAADKALSSLQANGHDSKDIGLIVLEETITRVSKEAQAQSKAEQVVDSAAAGAATGGMVGGLAGLVIGLSAITVPGLGALLIGGPLVAALGLTGAAATAVSGAATGAAAGGLLGAISAFGLPEDVVSRYEERLRKGGAVLAVPVDSDEDLTAVENILIVSGAEDVQTV